MKTSRHFISLITALLLSFTAINTCHAYTGQYNFRHLDSNNGLSANNVKCIVRDRLGFVWFGTKNGLNRYDGSKIKVYNCYDETLGRGNNNIGALYEDENSMLWIGTDRGIYRYDPHTDCIRYVDLIPDDGVAPENWVQRITGDRKGSVWALLPDQGVYRYRDGKVKHFPLILPGNLKTMYPAEICSTRDGNLWVVTTGDGILKYDDKAERFNRVLPAGYNDDCKDLCPICETPTGNLVVGTLTGALFEYNPTLDTLTALHFEKAGQVYLRYIECFGEELWIGTQIGLYIHNMRTGKTTEIRDTPLDPFSISDNTIYCIYRDNEDGAWIGTMFGGVNYMPRRRFSFTTYNMNSGLSSRLVLGLTSDRSGNIWIGTENAGVNVLDPTTGHIRKATAYNPADDIVLSMTTYDGEVYTSFSRSGLYRTNPATGHTRLAFPTDTSIDNNVYTYLIDSRGTEWVGLGFSLYRRKKGEPEFTHITETSYDWIYYLFEASDGTIWIGTMGNGLWKHNPDNGSFKSYIFDHNSDNPSGLRSNSINSIMEDSRGTLWISTDRGGLSRYDSANDKFESYGIPEGLPDDVVYSILEDSGNNLWFGTNHGLVRFTPANGDIQVFTNRDGIPFNQYNYKSAIKTTDGTFYMGGINGVISFRPDDFEEDTSEIPIYFTGLNILNEEMKADPEGNVLKENIVFAEKIALDYDESTFSVSVASPNFNHLGRVKFHYRLLPANKEWIDMNDNEISFTNLAPGNYTLEVKADNGTVSSTRQLNIRISPPWWKSSWAYFIYVVLFVLATAFSILWWLKRNERKLKEREQAFHDKKDKELYRSKVNFFTEIAHEIRTPLSLIDLPLEAIEEIGVDNPDIKRYVKVTRQNTKRLLELTGQLLDFQKIDAKRLTLKNENVNINEFVRHISERFEPSISLTGKHLECDFDAHPLVVSLDREALTKIVSNLLNNALKYATHTIRLTFRRPDNGDHFIISVASDGKKIAVDERTRIFQPFYQTVNAEEEKNGVGIGLPLSRSLATLLGGTLELEDNPDDMNVFTLTLPVTEPQAETTPSAGEIDGYMVEEGSNQTKPRSDIYSVLLVEDNENIASFLAEQLRNSFIVETVSNGVEALEKLKAGQFDIVVTDIMMPLMDGLELCRQVKADIDISHIPVVFITAKNDLETKVKGLQLGGEAYVEKPFSIKYLKQLLRSLLDNRRRERESFSKNPFFTVSNMQMNKADEEFMNKVRKIIEDNVSEEDFNVEIMCDRLAMSRSSLLRKIKTLFNLSPVELIRIIKLKKAAELIREGNYRISDVGYMVGIASPSYFSKIFFKQFGMTPKDFEKQCKSKTNKTASGNGKNTPDEE